MRSLRWLIFAPVALIALLPSPALAEQFVTWSCWQEVSWQMLQPVADYESGLYPNWQDCEAWRGAPND